MILAKKVALIRPVGFGFNSQTASDNVFQHSDIPGLFENEFDLLKEKIESVGIETVVFSPPDDQTPDAVFANNWFSTFPDGRLFLCPRMAASRRKERRSEFISSLLNNYQIENRLMENE